MNFKRFDLPRVYDALWIDVRESMLTFFHQVFCVPDPVAGLAGAGGLIVPQMLVQRFDKPDAFTQRNT